MNKEQQNIQTAFDKVVAELDEMRKGWIADASEDSDVFANYEGIDVNNAYIWFIEGLS